MGIIEEVMKSFHGPSFASTMIFLAVAGIVGILIGRIKLGSFQLGIAGVLFVGLILGHFKAAVDPHVLHFAKEFGLILFVYSIGIEIGPRFISSLKSNGLQLNIFAAMIVVLGFGCAMFVKYAFDLDVEVVAGLFSGGTTNTPSLGAGSALLKTAAENGMVAGSAADTAGMAYALAYPFGIIGIILAMALLRIVLKIDLNKEIDTYQKDAQAGNGSVVNLKVNVTNSELFGQSLSVLTAKINHEFIVSRIIRAGHSLVPKGQTVLAQGDEIVCICHQNLLAEVDQIIGHAEVLEPEKLSGELSVRHITITNKRISGKRLVDISLSSMYPANITRVFRGKSEIIPTNETRLEFGDMVRVVGERTKMKEVSKFLGNSTSDLAHPNIIPLFIGVFLGILLGSIPIVIPGLPMPAKLGVAGGPLIVALILGHFGRIGKLNFYITPSANLFIRELGIIMFLACVGLGGGGKFVQTLMGGGYMWMLYASIITFVPLFVVGLIARFFKLNYLYTCGVLAGSMTDPPALEFANNIAKTPAQATAYATVYPLTMFLRILAAQLLVLMLL